MTQTLDLIDLELTAADEPGCCWDTCSRAAVYRAVFAYPCGGPHPALVCIPHRAKADHMQAENAEECLGWTCHVCKISVGFIERWERA